MSRLRDWWGAKPTRREHAEKLLGELTLDTGQKWGEVQQPWQLDAYATAMGFPDAPGVAWHLLEVCGVVGAGKDQLAAALVLGLLHFGPPGVKVYVQSTDRDKSKDVLKSVRGFIRRDKRMGRGLAVIRDEVRCICVGCEKPDCNGCKKDPRGSRAGLAVCESLDGPSTSGAIYDVAILNEVQEWPAPHGEDVYSQIFARRHKRSGRVICLTNAPKTPKGEWRRDRWEEARRQGSDWYYIEAGLEGCPWITPDYVEEQKRNLPLVRFLRWFKLTPSDGAGGLLTQDEVERCVVGTLVPAEEPVVRAKRFLGIDAGIKSDHFTLSLLRLEMTGAIVLERQETWVPSLQETGEVKITDEVEPVVMDIGKRWGAVLVFDPWQSVQLRQNCEAAGIECVVFNSTATNLTEMAHSTIEAFRKNRVRIYPNAGFVQIDETTKTDLVMQLVAAEVREQERGLRVLHKRTKAGHGDAASSFLMALTMAMREGTYTVPATSSKRSGGETPDMGEHRVDRIRRLRSRHGGRFTGPRPTRRRARCAS